MSYKVRWGPWQVNLDYYLYVSYACHVASCNTFSFMNTLHRKWPKSHTYNNHVYILFYQLYDKKLSIRCIKARLLVTRFCVIQPAVNTIMTTRLKRLRLISSFSSVDEVFIKQSLMVKTIDLTRGEEEKKKNSSKLKNCNGIT